MAKTSNMNLRVDPKVKEEVETILSQLGLSMATAIDLYLNQIILTRSIPFSIAIPKMPKSIDIDQMTEEELDNKIKNSCQEYLEGKTYSFEEVKKILEEKMNK